MRRRLNPCVYTGLVGSKLKPRKIRAVRRIFYRSWKCDSGPLRGMTIRLDAHGDQRTLTANIRGEVGMYKGPAWIPHQVEQRIEA